MDFSGEMQLGLKDFGLMGNLEEDGVIRAWSC
jgi:hypothetical protein